MALTAAQRAKLPRSAFAIRGRTRSQDAYPLPTKAQARRAGISEPQRQRMLRAAAAYSARGNTRGSYSRIAPRARRRAGGNTRGGTAWGVSKRTGRRKATPSTAASHRRRTTPRRRRATGRRRARR
jgi:hypothetical protein